LKARQRRLSLRFLSWYILGEHIQTDTHDSIEDARSALRLYNAYQEFEEQGIFDQKLDEIYREGRQVVRIFAFMFFQRYTLSGHRISNLQLTLKRLSKWQKLPLRYRRSHSCNPILTGQGIPERGHSDTLKFLYISEIALHVMTECMIVL